MIIAETLDKPELWGRTLKNPLRKLVVRVEDFDKQERKLWQRLNTQLDEEFMPNLRLGHCDYCNTINAPRRQFEDTVICRDCERQYLMIYQTRGKKDASKYLEAKLGMTLGYRFATNLEQKGVMHTIIQGIGDVDISGLIEHPGISNLRKLDSVILYGAVIHPHMDAKEREPLLIVGGTVKDTLALLIGIGFYD